MKLNFFKRKSGTTSEETKNVKDLNIPKGWFVYEAGQSPVHMLWFVNLVNFDDLCNNKENVRHYWVEEKDSYEEALEEAIKMCQNDTSN